MSPTEVMTVLIFFQSSSYRNFKHYYTNYVPCVPKEAFPKQVSYNRFIERAQSILIPLSAYLHTKIKIKGAKIFVNAVDNEMAKPNNTAKTVR